MTHHSALTASGRVSAWPHWLGYAGLLPQVLLAAAAFLAPADTARIATQFAMSYAALILSFVGGAWWGLVSRSSTPVRGLVWIAAVTPSLIAFAALGLVALGAAPSLGLVAIGLALMGTLMFDHVLTRHGLCPFGWVRLRTPLSFGLSGLTLLIAVIALLADPSS